MYAKVQSTITAYVAIYGMLLFLCNAFRFIFETPSSKWRNKHVCVIYVCDGILFLTESNPLISDMCACVCSIKCTYTELDVIKEKQLLLPSLQIYFS